ncbi:MAG: toprim domain-containing protein, partial [Ferruginibacter sp.]
GGPKYINTKETPVYIKGDTVFGLFQAKEHIKKEKKVILMEGEFDAITAYKEGITNAIAIKGTALTENQIRLLKRFAQKIVFCFDTDLAGTEAQRRSIALITHEGINASVVIPPEGKDPDELLRENPIMFKKALKNEINIYDFIIQSSVQDEDPASVEGKKHILSRTLSYLSDIDNEIVKEHYLKKLADLLNTSYESVLKEAERTKAPTQKVDSPVIPSTKVPRQELLENHLMTLALQSPNPKESITIIASILEAVRPSTRAVDVIFETLKQYFATNEALNVAEITKLLPEDLIPAFDLYFLNPLPALASDEIYIHEIEKTAKIIKQSLIKERLNVLSEKMRVEEKAGNEDDLQALRVEFNTLATHFK